jgi:hypothetical protein
VNRGGISREIMQDVGGDPAGRYMPGLFTKTGTTDLSALASYLFDEDGFHQIRQDSDIGPARELEDLITRALGGEKVLSTTAMEKGMQAEETAKFKEKAQRLGVKTVARKLEDIAADVLRIEAQNVLDEETRLEEELLPAYNETVDALHAAIGEDAAENFLEDLASKYQDETHLNYLRSATADIQEKINEQAISAAEKPAEAAGRAAEEGNGTSVASSGDRTAGEEARPALTLSSQSEAELAAADKAAQAAEAQRLKDEQAAENKRQADAERGSFQLTGSTRPADVLAAQGQGGLFDAPTPPATRNPRANVVIRDVRDRDGNKLGDIIEPYDGTETGARKAAERASNRMWDGYQDASNIQSRIGATDENGRPKWAISPNFAHISPVDTAEGRATFGDEDAIREVYGKPTAADTIAGKPVADMSDDQLRTIARGLSPTFGETAVDKAKTEINRRNAALREEAAKGKEPPASLPSEAVKEREVGADTTAPKGNTEDAGDELTYNRRNRITRGLKWEDIADKNVALRVKEVTKAKVFPKPDYQALVDDGTNPLVAHLVKQVYDSIATVPSMGRRQVATDADMKLYIEAVNRVMDGVQSWATDRAAVAKWASRQANFAAAAMGKPTNLSDLESVQTLLDTVYPGGWKNYRQEVILLGGNKLLGALQPGYDEVQRATKDIAKSWPGRRESWQQQGYKVLQADDEVVRVKPTNVDGGYFIEVAGKYQTRFPDKASADQAASDLDPWLLLDKRGEIISGHPSEAAATEAARSLVERKHKAGEVHEKGRAVADAERTGTARRMEGENISSDRLKDDFGFRGINFGEWMKGESPSKVVERQLHLNHAYDAFLDLAEILDVPPKAMSLNGMLGLAIGAQGGGKALAHFVPGVNEINLTRTGGAGALAHEWGHALDHYFGTLAGLEREKRPYLTEHASATRREAVVIDGRTKLQEVALKPELRPEILDRFKAIVAAMTKRAETATEAKHRLETNAKRYADHVESWLRYLRKEFANATSPGAADMDAVRASALAAFDNMAARIGNLDLGEGMVAISRDSAISPVLAEMRDAFKVAFGRFPDVGSIKALQANIDGLRAVRNRLAADVTHEPQQIATDYQKASNAADDGKKKPYWGSKVEMFARAFDAFVVDTLAENAAKNSYLAGIEAVPPTGSERKAIGAAFRDLIAEIKTKETDKGIALESRAGRTREAFAANALQELATEDELFRYPVSQSSTLKGVFHDVFPGVEWHGESTRADEKDASGADQRYTLKTPDTPAKDGRPEVIGKQFEVYVTRDKVWIDVHRSMPGEQGSRIYAAVANFAYNTRRVFRGDPAGVSVDAIKARNKMMLASALRFGTTRHLEASTEQEKGIAPSLPPLDWSGSDIDKVRALIHTFITTVHNNAPDIKHYSYDFAKQKFIDNRTGLEFRPSFAAFDDALGRDQRRAAGIGADSGRAAILIQSLVREEGGGIGDGGILQAILDHASSLVSEAGSLKGVFSKTTPAQAGVSVSEVSDWIADARAKLKNIPEVEVVQSHTDIPDVGRRLRSAAERYLRDGDRDALDLVSSYEERPLEGAYIDGKIWLVADSLPTRDRALEVLAHEAVGHMAVEDMLDAVSPELMPRLVKQVQLLDGGGNPYIRKLGEDVDRTQPGIDKDARAKEIIAQIAERGDQGKDMAPMVRSLWQKILDGIKAFYKLVFDQALSDQDVRDIVATAERWARGEDHVTAEIDGAIKSASIGASETRETHVGDGNNMVPVVALKVGAGRTANRGMESRAAPINPQGPIWSSPDASRADDLIYTMQDKNVDLKRVQQGITKALGDIRDDVDAYLQEELFHGRAAKATEEFLERELQPFVGEMKQRGIDMDTLETFLWARHAKERNAQIAKINPDMPDGGSGLTDKQAADILAGKDVTTGGQTVKGVPQAKLRSLKDLAAKVDRMVAGNRILTETYELETPDTVDAWKGAYQHYVPLHREDADTPWAGNGTGQGYSVKGSSTKRATGSFRPVENILANLVLQRTRTITRGEKNRVAQALYGLAKESPNEGFWDTDNAPTIRTVENKAIYHVMDGKTEVANFTSMADAEKKARENQSWFMYQDWGDRVVEKIDPAFRSKPNVVWARFGGEDRFVIFNERDERAMRLAGSLKNLDADDISHLLGEVSRWTRYFASINTQYNPVFGVINLIRDTGTGLLNLKSTPLEGKQKEMLGNVWQALPAIYKAVRIDRQGGTPTGAWADLWEDFQEAGGKTGYRDMFKNSHEQHEALQMALDPTWWQSKWWGKALTVGGVLSVPEQLLADKIGKPVFEWLSDYNTMMENGIRLSAYKLALDEGMTKQRAASLAKNLTVNFNKKGQVARQAGALYAFFNASVQGTARMAETLHHGAKPGELLGAGGKQVVYGGMLLGAMQAMLLMMAGFDDDEPPEFVRDRNIIIPVGGGKYLTVPLPLGFHVLPAIGRIGTEFVLGRFKKPGKHVAHVFDVLADSFNPIGNAGISMQTLAPTVLDPAAALAENKDWTGKPIFRENMSGIDQKPGHARTKDTATGLSKGLAYLINAASGGTEFKPGLLSPTPDQIDYLIGQVTGGVGRETSKAFQTGSAAITGEDLPTYKIPLVGRFYGDTKGQAAVSGKFYENLKEMNEHQAEFMGLSKSNRSKEAQEYAKENPEAMMFREGDRLQRYISKLRDQKRTMLAKGEPREKIKAVDDQITKTMQGFNQRVDAKKTPQRGMTRVEVAN